MARSLSDVELRAWQGLLHVHELVVGRLDDELRREHGISFDAYDVLVRLARAPGRCLPMSELARRVMYSPSGLTRMVDRLVVAGLVRRRRFDDDARVTLACLTDRGRARVRAAAGTHLRGIREHFTGRLSQAQLLGVASGLEAIAGPHEPH